MLFVDVNVLIYASFTSSPAYESASSLMEHLRRAGEPLGLPSVVASGYLRVATQRGVFAEPKHPLEAMAYLDALLAAPSVSIVEPGVRHWGIFRGLIDQHALRGADVADAYLAAMAIERGATWVSYDRGFARFRELRWTNPEADERSLR